MSTTNMTNTAGSNPKRLRSLDWVGGWTDGVVEMIDQTRLPHEFVMLSIATTVDLVTAIKRLSVRGAPALGVAGGYGVVLAAREYDPFVKPESFAAAVAALRSARPTAVNLARMVDRVAAVAVGRTRSTAAGPDDDPRLAALAEATAIRDEEIRASLAMGELGADLMLALVDHRPLRVMTICNTGTLATVEKGTALAAVHTLHERGLLAEAIPLETRPLLQGARLTTWELRRMRAPHRLAVDSAGPFLLASGAADVVVIGADRVAANGDVANKVGSLSLALGAAHAGVPFVVVAPESTVDLVTPDGSAIEVEDRGPAEVLAFGATPTAPDGTAALNPAFDVTPAHLITALVTDRRVVRYDHGDTPGGGVVTPAAPTSLTSGIANGGGHAR